MKKSDMLEKMSHSLKEAEEVATYLSDEAFKNWKKYGEVQNEKNADFIEQAEIVGGILNSLDEIDTLVTELKFYIKKENEKNEN